MFAMPHISLHKRLDPATSFDELGPDHEHAWLTPPEGGGVSAAQTFRECNIYSPTVELICTKSARMPDDHLYHLSSPTQWGGIKRPFWGIYCLLRSFLVTTNAIACLISADDKNDYVIVIFCICSHVWNFLQLYFLLCIFY